MESISTQFQIGLRVVEWIDRSYDVIRSLRDKIPFIANHEDFKSASEFWTMGPKRGQHGKYFIYWHADKGSMERSILSISIIKDTQYIMVFCSDRRWRKFDINKSAHNWAKLMDLFLNGYYTNIPPLNIRSIIDYIDD